MTRIRTPLSIVIASLVAAAMGSPAWACTLFAAAGGRVEGGGVLIAKNRDWRPNQTHILRRVTGPEGHPYYGLFAQGGEDPGLKAGINAQGLVVVSATAPFPRRERQAMPRTAGLIAKLLSSSATVDEALTHAEWLRGPRYLMIGDRRSAAVIEIAPDGRTHVDRTETSVLYHTNHYTAANLLGYNPPRIGASSRERYRRIEQLLGGTQPFTLEQFIRMSDDRAGGPDRSIWRDGSSPTATRTVAAWIVYQPSDGTPQIYVKTADPGVPPVVRRLSFDTLWR